DVAGANERDPLEEFRAIDSELAEYDANLAKRPTIVVATKMDAADLKKVQKLQRWCKKNHLDLIKISSVTGEGLDELIHAVFSKLSGMHPVAAVSDRRRRS